MLLLKIMTTKGRKGRQPHGAQMSISLLLYQAVTDEEYTDVPLKGAAINLLLMVL